LNAIGDETRAKKLNDAGFRMLRFWNNEVLSEIEAVKEAIWRVLKDPSPPRSLPWPIPIPGLPLEGEGEYSAPRIEVREDEICAVRNNDAARTLPTKNEVAKWAKVIKQAGITAE
jgi:hypothetical protein